MTVIDSHLDVALEVFDRFPDVHFVIDHLGLDQSSGKLLPSQPWADLQTVLDLARRPLTPFLRFERLSASERAMLMGGACAKCYQWSPLGATEPS